MTSSLLYEQWMAVVSSRPNEFALKEIERIWTFRQLATAVEQSVKPDHCCVFPTGSTSKFILDVLRGWKHGIAVCPLEPDQPPPLIKNLPSECIHVKTTSGTTAAPRLVIFNGQQMAADADQIVRSMGLRSDWPNVGVISLAHSYGFSNLVLPLLLHGIPLILGSSPLPHIFSHIAATEPNITVPAVPVLWRTWLDAHVLSKNIRLAISAGAPLSVDLEREIFEVTGIKVHTFYGSSECGGIAYDANATPRTDGAFVGNTLSDVQTSINSEGCLQVKSSAVGQGYWPESDTALQNGCFQTSDLAELKGKDIYLRGRIGDIINIAARKVSAQHIERVLMGFSGVKECVVFSVPSSRPHGDRECIVALIAGMDSSGLNPLKQYVATRLPSWQIPKFWGIVDSIGANARGKILRDYWRDFYLKSHSSNGKGQFSS